MTQYITTIVTEFLKFKYNRLHMVMCTSGDLFQAKVDRLIDSLNLVLIAQL